MTECEEGNRSTAIDGIRVVNASSGFLMKTNATHTYIRCNLKLYNTGSRFQPFSRCHNLVFVRLDRNKRSKNPSIGTLGHLCRESKKFRESSVSRHSFLPSLVVRQVGINIAPFRKTLPNPDRVTRIGGRFRFIGSG